MHKCQKGTNARMQKCIVVKITSHKDHEWLSHRASDIERNRGEILEYWIVTIPYSKSGSRIPYSFVDMFWTLTVKRSADHYLPSYVLVLIFDYAWLCSCMYNRDPFGLGRNLYLRVWTRTIVLVLCFANFVQWRIIGLGPFFIKFIR